MNTEFEIRREEVLAIFGEARLLKRDGHIELHGGSMSDRTEALEWMARFLPDEVIRMRK